MRDARFSQRKTQPIPACSAKALTCGAWVRPPRVRRIPKTCYEERNDQCRQNPQPPRRSPQATRRTGARRAADEQEGASPGRLDAPSAGVVPAPWDE